MLSNENSMNRSYSVKWKTIRWPFKRYQIMLPKHVKTDTLQWLYLSLISYVNATRGNDSDIYSDDVKADVKKLIQKHFDDIISPQVLDKVVSNTEKEFITVKDHKIKKEALEFMNTYQEIFSSESEIRYIFQDLVTGSILPCFYTSVELANKKIDNKIGRPLIAKDETEIIPLNIVFKKKPTQIQIKKAYAKYMRLSKINDMRVTSAPPESIPDESSDEYDDYYEEQVFLEEDTSVDDEIKYGETKNNEIKNELKTLKNLNIIFVEDETNRIDYAFDVDINVEDGKVWISTPFEEYTAGWLTSCFDKGSNANEQLKGLKESVERLIPKSTGKIKSFTEESKDGVYSALNHCRRIYDLLKDYNREELNEYVLKLEEAYEHKITSDFFMNCAKIMENLINNCEYSKSDCKRRSCDYDSYKKILHENVERKGINCNPLFSEETFDKWQSKYDHNIEVGTEHFKSDLADFLMFSGIADSPKMTKWIVHDIIVMYNRRNDNSHDKSLGKKGIKTTPPCKEDLFTLEEIIELFNEKR